MRTHAAQGYQKASAEGNDPLQALKSPDLATDLATLGDLESVTIRIRVDLDDDLLHGNAGCLATADRLHRNETGRRHLRQRTREIRLCSPAHLHEFRNRLWLTI